MLRRTMNLKLRPGVTREEWERLERIVSEAAEHIPALHESVIAPNRNEAAGRDYVWELLAEDISAVRTHPYHDDELTPAVHAAVEALDVAYTDPVDVQVPEPGLQDVVKVTMLVELRADLPDETKWEYVDGMAAAFAEIPELRNQVLSRAVPTAGPTPIGGPERWTHVVEQEFAGMEGMVGYLKSPAHEALADRWRWADPAPILHVRRVFYRHATSVLAWYERVARPRALS